MASVQEEILGVLTRRGIVSSDDLQSALGVSQATASRALAELSNQVLTLGRARATRYALPQAIRGLPAQQELWWTHPDGSVQALGTLSFLCSDQVHVESAFAPSGASRALPWYLAPLRVQGFLGRLHAQRLQLAGLGGDPDRWPLQDVLFAALHLHDVLGAITLGAEPASATALPRVPSTGAGLAPALDALAGDLAKTLPAGSSAGGEQPKFLACTDAGQHLLVKFTPPRGTPFGERWHDLLHAEHLAHHVLAAHGVAVAQTRLVETDRRSYLLSQRFDRLGERGRRHMVAVGDVHTAFVADRYVNWAATARVLARQGRLSALDAQRVAALLAFGRLIGNSDMHAGNLSLFVGLPDLAKGRFQLAAVYDMLPMRWRPQAELGGAPDYAAFELDAASLASGARAPAQDYWQRLAALSAVSPGLRQVAAEMAQQLRAG